jgi:hypothetical protein
LSCDSNQRTTGKSNGLPPEWAEVFTFRIEEFRGDETLAIRFVESRVFSDDQSFGDLEIPVGVLPSDAVLIEWVPLAPSRDNLLANAALIMAHLSSDGGDPFAAPRARFAEMPAWDLEELSPEDIRKLPADLRPSGDEAIEPHPNFSRAIAQILEECFAPG